MLRHDTKYQNLQEKSNSSVREPYGHIKIIRPSLRYEVAVMINTADSGILGSTACGCPSKLTPLYVKVYIVHESPSFHNQDQPPTPALHSWRNSIKNLFMDNL